MVLYRSTPVRKYITLSDIIAGAVGVLIVLPDIIDQRSSVEERIAVIASLLVGLLISWKFTRDRHWIMKTLLFAGICLIGAVAAQLIVRAL